MVESFKVRGFSDDGRGQGTGIKSILSLSTEIENVFAFVPKQRVFLSLSRIS